MSTSMKAWATPLATATFVILAVTGSLMFFKVEAGIIKPVHEWLSWAMTAGVVLHIIANWKSFTGYFSRKPALSIIGTGIVVTLITVFAPAGDHQNPRMNMTKALASAKLETVAEVAGQNSATLIEKLGSKGMKVGQASMSVREIAKQNNIKDMEVLALIFDQPSKGQ
jgi:hypothetical protein